MIYQKVNQGNEFIVVKNSKPAFKIVPINKKEKINHQEDNKKLIKKLKKIQFVKNKNLSQKIDNIVYDL